MFSENAKLFCKKYLIFMKKRAQGSKIATPVHVNVIFSARLGLDAECFADHVHRIKKLPSEELYILSSLHAVAYEGN